LFGEKGTNEVGGIIFGFGKISVAFQPYKWMSNSCLFAIFICTDHR
jgi:hypothetical protein